MSRGSTSQQYALQQESIRLQREDSARQATFLDAQLALLRKNQVAEYKPLAPPPTAGISGADTAQAQQLIEEQRRFGYSDTTRGGFRLGLGGRKAA